MSTNRRLHTLERCSRTGAASRLIRIVALPQCRTHEGLKNRVQPPDGVTPASLRIVGFRGVDKEQ